MHELQELLHELHEPRPLHESELLHPPPQPLSLRRSLRPPPLSLRPPRRQLPPTELQELLLEPLPELLCGILTQLLPPPPPELLPAARDALAFPLLPLLFFPDANV